ncbi:sulfotransferase family protein [Marinobacter sp. M216]|uniref:Sulfotransferase family protein n=1 Tax=Marinobacter albus TaxID=3030833 RepID=A0ABT7HBJ9_9GAMM|nr:sulfotransferase family protein [Marinobacter sp. M216]MDK9557287.1 sulfotransferase family protein [Marinobacter sp. M216]
MISHDYKMIFIHVPKSAGTSIENAFGHDLGAQGRGSQDHRAIREIEPVQISNYLRINSDNANFFYRRIKKLKTNNPNNKIGITRKQYQEYFKFTIVRNPFSRTHSWYRGIMRDPINLRAYGLPSPIPFEEFLDRFLHKRRLMKPAVWFLKSFNGGIELDFVGKFENLTHDFGLVCDQLGVQVSLPHKLDGGGTDWRSEYNDRTRSMVEKFYHEDISTFGYKFE